MTYFHSVTIGKNTFASWRMHQLYKRIDLTQAFYDAREAHLHVMSCGFEAQAPSDLYAILLKNHLANKIGSLQLVNKAFNVATQFAVANLGLMDDNGYSKYNYSLDINKLVPSHLKKYANWENEFSAKKTYAEWTGKLFEVGAIVIKYENGTKERCSAMPTDVFYPLSDPTGYPEF
jgi:hypothetical protein